MFRVLIIGLFCVGNVYSTSAQNNFFMGGKYAVSFGMALDAFETYGDENFYKFNNDRWMESKLQPFVGFSFIKGIQGRNCCKFIRLQGITSLNQTEFTRYKRTETSEEVTGKVTSLYHTVSGQYGWFVGENWRLGPVVSISFRSGSVVKEADKAAVSYFGIYNIEKDRFNRRFKNFDIALGASVVYKLNQKLFVQGELNYGVLPQITLPGEPSVYHPNLRLGLGLVLN